jgi:IS30 family transposase
VPVSRAILAALTKPQMTVRTLTADNGAEFARHKGLALRLEAQVYFARPYQAWQRGLNEHTNGLVRQYLPKGTDLDTVSPHRVRDIQNSLNNRPRAVLGYRTPREVFSQMSRDQTNGALEM